MSATEEPTAVSLQFTCDGDFDGLVLARDGDNLTISLTRQAWDEVNGEVAPQQVAAGTMDLDDWLGVIEQLVSELEGMRRD